MLKFVLALIFIGFAGLGISYFFDAKAQLALTLKVHDPDAFIRMGYDLCMLIAVGLSQIGVLLMLIIMSMTPILAVKPNLLNTLDEV